MTWITTTDVHKETWRYLLEFANTDIALAAIARRHSAPLTKSDRSNHKKQALQLRACLLQAHEYFLSAERASEATSPNLLYYGMQSLTSAVMLLLGDGQHSLDVLRSNTSNRHHGLRFTTAVTSPALCTGVRILSDSTVTIASAGHFRCWYDTLPLQTPNFGQVETVRGSHHYKSRQVIAHDSHASFSAVNGLSRSLLDLVQYLPDFHPYLERYGLTVERSRITRTKTAFVNQDDSVTRMVFEWRIHGARTNAGLHSILNGFLIPPSLVPNITSTDTEAPHSNCVIRLDTPPYEFNFQSPTVRSDLNQIDIMYAVDLQLPEMAEIHLAAFGLSMLSRYFPDLWITTLESHTLASQVVDRFFSVAFLKAPLLAAQYMTGDDLVISAQPPPWWE